MSAERIVHWDPFQGPQPNLGAAVLSIGIYDGVHAGHRVLLAQAASHAHKLGSKLVVITFDADPDEFFGSDPCDKLLSDEDRLQLIADVSGGTVLSLPADATVFSLEPGAFLDALEKVCTPQAFYVGSDFRFGTRASGTAGDIGSWCLRHSCACTAFDLVEVLGAPVTATRIRALLRDGDVAQARELLGGRAHSVKGTVVHGRGEGTGFGFATANLELSAAGAMLPREGVYGGYASVDGRAYPAAINVGVAKSFAQATAPLEVHLLDFEGDLYGKAVEVSFIAWLREPRVFESQEELIATVTDNINWVRENLGGDGCGSHR